MATIPPENDRKKAVQHNIALAYELEMHPIQLTCKGYNGNVWYECIHYYLGQYSHPLGYLINLLID